MLIHIKRILYVNICFFIIGNVIKMKMGLLSGPLLVQGLLSHKGKKTSGRKKILCIKHCYKTEIAILNFLKTVSAELRLNEK